MKRLLLALMVLLCLCSCTKKEIKPILTEISFTGELTYFNEIYVFDGEILKDGTLKATIKEPEELEELKLTVTEKGMRADYKGLTYEANEATMPFSRIVQEFYTPLNMLIGQESLTANKNGEISGKAGETDYLLTLSPTGLPQKLELETRHITVRFYNISIKEE